jgi:hypothetical protein
MLDQNKTSQELLDQNVISQLIVGDQEYEINAKYWGGLQPSIINEEIKNLEEKIDNISIATTEVIQIAGGPLEVAAKEVYPDGEIPIGTSFQDIFLSLFCKEIYPVPTVENGSYKISISAPSITAKDEKGTMISNKSLMEIGDRIYFNKVTANSVVVTKTNPEISGFEYGYSDTFNGEIIEKKSVSVTWNCSQVSDDVYKLSATTTNFVGDIPIAVSKTNASECQINSCDFEISKGENKYEVTESAPGYVGSHEGIGVKYIVSNLGKRDEKQKTTSIDSKSNSQESASNSKGTFTITGVYPIFTNGEEASTDPEKAGLQSDLQEPTGQTKYKLIDASNTDVTIAISFASHSKAPYTIWIPFDWKLKDAWRFNGATGKWNTSSDKDNFKLTSDTIIIHEKNVNYNKYSWKSTEGANRVKITIGKK